MSRRAAAEPSGPIDAPVDAPAGAPGDGRLERGRASREAILDAAARVIRSEGIDALTHRSVAAAAGMPLARVSYHFSTVQDLTVAGAGRFLERFDERLTELAESGRAGERTIVDACAQFMVELLTVGRDEFVAALQVRLALHRRGLVVGDDRMLVLIRSFGADDAVAAAIFSALFGFATLVATGPDPVDPAQVHEYVRLVLESMTARAAGSGEHARAAGSGEHARAAGSGAT
jgi:AcrR family transcriptional regulator